MKVLILGGTGAMGVHLVSILSNSGVEVVVTSRNTRQPNGNIQYIKGNAQDKVFLKKLLTDKWDAIVDFMVYSTAEFRDRVELFLLSTNQYVFFSSSRVFANSTLPLTETSPRLLDTCKDKEYLKTDEYGLAKARQEDILTQSGFNNWTIIRPSITYSEHRLQLGDLEKENWLYRALSNRTIVFSRDINSKYVTLTYGYDVALGISKIIGKNESFSQIFNITVGDAYRWEEILSIYLNTIKDITGNKPRVLILEKSPLSNRYIIKYDRLYDRFYDNSKIIKYANTTNFIPPLKGLKHCLEQFLKNPIFSNIDWKKEAFYDRLAGEFTPLNEIVSFKNKLTYLSFRFLISYKFSYKIHQFIRRHGY